MMTGMAVSRAIRGHLLVDAALSSTLLADVYNVPVPTKMQLRLRHVMMEQTKKKQLTVSSQI